MPRTPTSTDKIDRTDAAFDIETEAWDRFVYGGVSFSTGEYFDTDCEHALFEKLVAHNGDVWTWNGGRYDLIWLTELARDRGLTCSIAMAGTRITRCQIKGSKARFRDAMALWPRSLAYALDILTPGQRQLIYGDRDPKATGLVCSCDLEPGQKPCGGYCRIVRGMAGPELAALRQYLRGDCDGLLAIVDALRDEFEACDYHMGGTVGGSAYATAARWAELEPASWMRSRDYAFARSGYYGGRSQVFRPQADSGHRYDIHSAYPAALTAVRLPTGEYGTLGGDRAARAYAVGHEGIFQAKVRVPLKMYIPPLPWRSKSGRVCYPIGDFTGAWTGLELRYAESLGVKVQIGTGIVWLDSAPVLKDVCERVWANRNKYPKPDPRRDLHKWFANSLTGKLAERPDKQRVILHPKRDQIKACPSDGDCSPPDQPCRFGRACCAHRCTGYCKRWKPIGPWASLWSAPFWRISDCGHVHWAAHLTAATRIELHRMLVADGRGGRTALYCDTDSCYSTEPRTHRIGDELGQWGSDGGLTNWLAAAPKAYRFLDDAGEVYQRCKGLEGISPDEWSAWFGGATIERDRGVFGLRDAARRPELDSLFSRKLVTRSRIDTAGVWYGDRLAKPDGRTYPQTVKEIRYRETQA